MRRRLLNLATWRSLGLCVAIAGSWVRSYWGSESIQYTFRIDGDASERYLSLSAGYSRGRVDFTFDYTSFRNTRREMNLDAGFTADTRRYDRFDFVALAPQYRWRFANFEISRSATNVIGWDGDNYHHSRSWLFLPHWLLVAALAVAPAIRFIRASRSARRQHSGACPHCGYDLRATPDRCPECGQPAKTA